MYVCVCVKDDPLSTVKMAAHLSWVLDAYSLDVVDVFKLLSLFIMSALPIMGDMQNQLYRIENYILSSMAWREVGVENCCSMDVIVKKPSYA